MPATLDDLIRYRGLSKAGREAIDAPFFPNKPVPEPQPNPPEPPAWFTEALAKLDSLSARCDALIERNGRWTRYVTGGENA